MTKRPRKNSRLEQILAWHSGFVASGEAEAVRKDRELATSLHAEIAAAVRAAGVQWVGDLEVLLYSPTTLSPPDYHAVARVLLARLAAPGPRLLVMDLARFFTHAPSVALAREHWCALATLFEQMPADRREFVASALATICNKEHLAAIERWLGDRGLGVDRIFFLPQLRRLVDKPRRLAMLKELSQDPDLAEQCSRELRGLGPKD